MASLTKRKIDATKPVPGREVRLWDDDPRGFGCIVKPSGLKLFFIQFRSPATGKKRRFFFEQYGRLTLEQARDEAKRLFGRVADGEDPLATKRQDRDKLKASALSIAELCDIYLKDAEQGLVTYRGKAKKRSTLATDKGRVERHIKPLLGATMILELSKADVVSFLHAVRIGKTAAQVRTKARGVARVTGGNGTARRTMGLLGSILNYAVAKGLRPDNPCRGIEREPDRKRQRSLSPEEYRRLGKALEVMEQCEMLSATAARAFRVLALTGCRKMEVFGLKRQEVDAHNSCLRFEDTKTGQQLRPVGAAPIRLIVDAMKKAATDRTKKDWVFPASHGEGHQVDVKAFRRACELAEIEGVSLHTLRHAFGTVANELGYSDITIAGLLGHARHSITSHYAHHVDRVLVAAADRVSSIIEARMAGQPENQAGNVIELRQARG